jgi:hypothetical protein
MGGSTRFFSTGDGFWQVFSGHGQGIGSLEEVRFNLSVVNEISGSASVLFTCSVDAKEVGTFALDGGESAGGTQTLSHTFRAPFPGGAVDIGESVRLEVRSTNPVPSGCGNWLINISPPGSVMIAVAPFTHPFHQEHPLRVSSLTTGSMFIKEPRRTNAVLFIPFACLCAPLRS